MSENGGRLILGLGSKVTLGFLVAILGTLIVVVWQTGRWVQSVDNRLEAIEHTLKRENPDWQRWALELRYLNPSLNIPDPD